MKTANALQEVIDIAELGVQPGHVALKWTMQQPLSVIPIVGATKISQLENLETTELMIPAEDMQHLDSVSSINLGFPGEFFKEGVK